MFYVVKPSPAAVVAIFFLFAGGMRPFSLLLDSVRAQSRTEYALEDMEDGEEKEAGTNESGSEDDIFKIMAGSMSLPALHQEPALASTDYLEVFKEHHPSVITPPPKG